MFIKKRFSVFFEPFRAHLHSKVRKSANKSKKNFIQKFNMGIKKRRKIPHKKVISKNVTEICTFFTFTHVYQTGCNSRSCLAVIYLPGTADARLLDGSLMTVFSKVSESVTRQFYGSFYFSPFLPFGVS